MNESWRDEKGNSKRNSRFEYRIPWKIGSSSLVRFSQLDTLDEFDITLTDVGTLNLKLIFTEEFL